MKINYEVTIFCVHCRNLCTSIGAGAGADGGVIQIMATPVSVLTDVDGRLGISLAVPHEDQDVEATIVTESVVENKKANFQSGDDGMSLFFNCSPFSLFHSFFNWRKSVLYSHLFDEKINCTIIKLR